MKKNRFFTTNGGNFLVIPIDGSSPYYMTNQFAFERLCRERSASYLSTVLPEVEFVTRYSLPAMIPWHYLYHSINTSFSDTDGIGISLAITFGRIFLIKNKYEEKQIVTMTMIPDGARHKKVTLTGAEGVPDQLTLYAFSDEFNKIAENDSVPVEELGHFNCKKVERDLSYYIDDAVSKHIYINAPEQNKKIYPDAKEKARIEKVFKEVFKMP